MNEITVGIVDDHQLFLKSLRLLLSGFSNITVTVEALNGKDLKLKIEEAEVPQIMLIDVNMPVMDGVETTKWLKNKYPKMKLVALSMNDADRSIIGMIKAGCCAYLLKDTHPDELEKALNSLAEKGYYNGETGINYGRLLAKEFDDDIELNKKEEEFLQLACSDEPYKEIAKKMDTTVRTIDGYRESLFKKFNVQSRVGLVLEALRRDLIKL